MTDNLCCSDFYEDDMVRFLLQDVLHPGGLDLTRELAGKLGISSTSRVLDVASGTGETALFLSRTYSCSVVGIDASEKNTSLAREKSLQCGLQERVRFQHGQMEALSTDLAPSLGQCDVILSECSLCLTDRKAVLSSLRGLLPGGGKLGITDFVATSLPADFRTLFFRLLCIANAPSMEELMRDVESAGFTVTEIEFKDDALFKTLEILKKRLFLAELSGFMKRIDLSRFGVTKDEIKPLIERSKQLIREEKMRYVMLIAENR